MLRELCLFPVSGYKFLDKLLKEIDGDGADGKFTTPEIVDWSAALRTAERLLSSDWVSLRMPSPLSSEVGGQGEPKASSAAPAPGDRRSHG